MIIEEKIITYLERILPVPVYAEVPAEMPTCFVTVDKTGSGRTNWVSNATIAIRSRAATKFEAALLNEKVKAAMDGIVELDEITGCRLNSDYSFTDTARNIPSYQAVFDIFFYD